MNAQAFLEQMKKKIKQLDRKIAAQEELIQMKQESIQEAKIIIKESLEMKSICQDAVDMANRKEK